MQKADRERQHGEWSRARLIAHSVYLYTPTFTKGLRKETDPRKFLPLPLDDEMDGRRERPVIKLTQKDIAELNRIKQLIK